MFFSFYTKVPTDITTAKSEREGNHQISGVHREITRTPVVYSGAAMNSNYNLRPPTSNQPQPKIDATDRRQIEAQNEDKSHTTKDTLDDIKRIHYKEKQKKELSNMEPGPSGINIGWVRTRLSYILNSHH